MIKRIVLDFGTLEFHGNVAIGIINEGIDLTQEQESEIFSFCQQQFGDENFAYISHRINSYSFNPFMHKEVANLQDGLQAYAVVAKTPAQRLSFAIEKLFFKKPCGFFLSMEDALEWSRQHLKTRSNIQAFRRSK
ncbi:STAS/SEC14 domain-containing protein [Robertkochia marina]|uniref:STAS/SEC14 domain-containing protein n=1 Tax=Robertkochia marina TaxID=1227945 RepID=A0A4S3LZ33_9FLAO|nr:STAS/SEC14 domain-containing protein [Robertkochia marina]THD66696.1 STAS/SEC14 domain-containing protein [Robertkochia marina]TRZ45466.1 STAS/SEC14 domain-containing protein [Robertkochia marina]